MSGDEIFSDDWGFGKGASSGSSWSNDGERDAEREFIRGVELHRDGKIDAAISAYNAAVQLDPDHLQALNNLAVLLRTKGALDTAEAAYRRALSHDDRNPGFHFNLGNVLRDQGRYHEALKHMEWALDLLEEEGEYHAAYGLALRDVGRMEEALKSLERAHELKPNLRNIATDRAITCLLKDDYEAGFAALWQWQRSIADASRFSGIPLWEGEPLNGRSLLLQSEPADADNILFARYAPYAARLAKEKSEEPGDPGMVVLESPTSLTQLFSTIEGIDVHLNRGTGGPDPDLRFPLMCLPGLCGTRFDSVPDKVPYIGPPKGRTFDLPGAVPDRLKIGVIWESSDAARHRRLSNVPLRELLPLAARRDVTLYSLQKGPAAVDLMRFLASGLIHDLSNEIDDYLDMARAMSALDLVIAVDSVSTQLAAAMGLEIWVMADYACDWRWRRSGEKTPWYPTARIFRQSEPGDWAGVIAEVSQALTAGRSPAG